MNLITTTWSGASVALIALALFALAGASQATTVASIAVEDGSSTVLANDTIIIDGSLGGPHPGRITVANSSSLTLNNVTLTFVNGTAEGGIWVGSAALLVINGSTLSADPTARFAIAVTGAATLEVRQSQLLGLQATEDFAAAAITVDGGSTFLASGATMRVRPDVRPLLDAVQSELNWTSCNVTGSIGLLQSTAVLRLLTQRVIGDTAAIDTSGSTVSLSNSTIDATGGASAVMADAASSITIRSTNLTAEDIAVSARAGSTVTLRDVIAQAGSDLSGPVGDFGLVAESAAIVATNIAVIGFPNSLWLKNADATLTGAQLGGGIVRLNGSRASIDRSPALSGIVFVESTSTLTLTDTGVDWTKIDVAPPSEVVTRFRPTFEFYDSASSPAGGVNWSVYAEAGPFVGSGVSQSDGTAEGPPLEGPHYLGTRFDRAPAYRIQMSYGAVAMNETITAWGPGIHFPFHLDPALGDLAFESPLGFSDSNPPDGSTFTVSARILLEGATGPVSVSVRLMVDGVAQTVRTVAISSGSPYSASFNLTAASGVHLVGLRVDLENGIRGSFPETNEAANNALAQWYNASAGNFTSVKPDLVVTPEGLTFVLINATARDPVTGELREARRLSVTLNVRNFGLTAAGAFDVVVAVGTKNEGASITGIAAGGSANVTLTFGPYIDTQDLNVFATIDVRDRIDEGNEANNKAESTAHIELPVYVPPPRPLWVTLLVLAGAAGLVIMSAWGVLMVFRRGEEDSDMETPPASAAKEAAKPAVQDRGGSANLAAAPASAEPAKSESSVAPAPPVQQPKAASMAPSPPAAPPPAPVLRPPPPPSNPPAQRPMPMPPVSPPMAPPPGYSWQYPANYGPPLQYPPYYPQPPPGAATPGSRYVPPSPSGPPAAAPSAPRPPARCLKCGSTQVSYVLAPVREITCGACGAKDTF